MKSLLISVSFLALVGCGSHGAPSNLAQTRAVPQTAADLVGTYTGEGILSTSGPCSLTFKIEKKGLFQTPYLAVQLNVDSFSAKVSDVNASLAQITNDNPNAWIDAKVVTGVLAETDHGLQLLFHDGVLDGVHYQTASFSGGWIQGEWHIVDCSITQASHS